MRGKIIAILKPVEKTVKSDTRARRSCQHCGTPFTAKQVDERFCCAGCEYVFQLIRTEGLDRFYELKAGVSEPVFEVPFSESNWDWLTRLVAENSAGQLGPVTLGLQGASCMGCVWLIQSVAARTAGISDCRVDLTGGRIHFAFAHEESAVQLAKQLQNYGYQIIPVCEGAPIERGPTVGQVALCAVFTVNSWLMALPRHLGIEESFELAGLFTLLGGLLATLAIFIGGSYFLKRSNESWHRRCWNGHLLVAVLIVVGYLLAIANWLLSDLHILPLEWVATFTFAGLLICWLMGSQVRKNGSTTRVAASSSLRR